MEALFETLCQTADGAYVINDRQRIVFWNGAAESMLGYTADEVLGRACYQVFGAHDEQGWAICRHNCTHFVDSTHGELVPNFDAFVRTKAGEGRWVNVSIIGVPSDEQRSNAVIHLFRDIHAKKQAEAFAMEVAAQARQLNLRRPAQAATPEVPNVLEQLTPREAQILRLLASGCDTNAIAAELVISKATARNHIQHILHKLGVHSRLEAIAYVHQHGFIELE